MDIENAYRSYNDQANFLLIYVDEAHPVDGWMTPDNQAEGIIVHRPKSHAERQGLASLCQASLRLEMPTVVDTIDNRVASVYAGYPDRIFVLDEKGIVRFKSLPGPFGFKPAQAIEALDRLMRHHLTSLGGALDGKETAAS